ncbi:MAG TPA: lipid A-modifier LpxR family protein [Candidatus Polarisedimenticolia bacterium]|nr:lipid A-modifier LpxR family protein [Candidatus Polarisedimenticolia bacterium]
MRQGRSPHRALLSSIRRALFLLTLAGLAAQSAPALAAQDEQDQPLVTTPVAMERPSQPRNDFRDQYLFRFEFDNDTFLGDDNSFTAGWSFQFFSRLDDEWAPGYKKWIGKVPGLGDDGRDGRVTRWAWGLSQVIITPNDISIETPQPNDAPWAGILGIASSWEAYDNRRMAALQAFLGCQGPCSGAESVQKYIHQNLGFGEPPAGWDNQLAQKAIFNAHYEYRYKVYAPAAERYFTPRRFTHDFSVGGQGAVGNFVTVARAQVEYRFGWGLPMGFTKVPDPAGWGIMLDPIYVNPVAPLPSEAARWRAYFTIMLRQSWFAYQAPSEGGPTESGYNHPKTRPYPADSETILGFHLARIPFAVHVTYFRYMDPQNDATESKTDWVNLSFEYRF